MTKDPFLLLSPEERQLYIKQASLTTGRGVFIYEKDFWVCWILKILFTLPEFREQLTFKGGTALSKVYGVISRFSEDIDISLHRSFLGFGGDNDPENAISSNKRIKALEGLHDACASLIKESVLPALSREISKHLTEHWSLEIDSNDPQTLLFNYPTIGITYQTKYILPFVKIEFGARSDNWPKDTRKVTSYISETFPDIFKDAGSAEVSALSIGRTFWEKATILHAEFHRPPESKIPERYSRHYYDLHCIAESPHRKVILKDLSLLERVAKHKMIFFHSKWANYETAHPGKLRLYPQEAHIEPLKKDYQDMQSMFLDTPPQFVRVLEVIKDLENEINTTK